MHEIGSLIMADMTELDGSLHFFFFPEMVTVYQNFLRLSKPTLQQHKWLYCPSVTSLQEEFMLEFQTILSKWSTWNLV